MHPTDDQLASATLKGDERAFEALIDRYRSPLYRIARGMLQDRDLAADAVQEAFLHAYSALGKYRGRGQFHAWIRRILVNQVIGMLRRKRGALSFSEMVEEPACPAQDPEEQCVAKCDADALRQAIAELPDHYRSALVLRVCDELSYREIAGLLGVSESSVETWIHRGRARLRARFGPTGDPLPAPSPARPSAPRLLHRRPAHDLL